MWIVLDVPTITDRNGRRLKRSTATVDRKRAQKIADQFEEAARRKRRAIQVRRVISELHREITSDDFSHTSVRGFIDSWLERKEPEVAPSTLAFYRNAASKFLAFLGPITEDDLTAVTRDQLTQFRNEQRGRLGVEGEPYPEPDIANYPNRRSVRAKASGSPAPAIERHS